MVESGEQERPSEDPRSRFARLSAEIDDQHQRLDDLETRISTLNRLAGDDPHRHEQHFIDG